MLKCLLLFLLLFSFLPVALADVPPVPKPNAEIVTFGLQVVCKGTAQELPVTILDVMEGKKELTGFSSADQIFVCQQLTKYATSVPHSPAEKALIASAKNAFLIRDPSAQNLHVNFIVHPYLELSPDALPAKTAKNDVAAYGQPINVGNADFAEFLRSLSPYQKMQTIHGSPLTVSDLSPKQRLLVSNFWQTSSQPERVKLCFVPDTQVIIGFYLEAIVVQTYQNSSLTYHLQMPQPNDFFRFEAARGKQGQVWMRF